jgi:hypothetical protein
MNRALFLSARGIARFEKVLFTNCPTEEHRDLNGFNRVVEAPGGVKEVRAEKIWRTSTI